VCHALSQQGLPKFDADWVWCLLGSLVTGWRFGERSISLKALQAIRVLILAGVALTVSPTALAAGPSREQVPLEAQITESAFQAFGRSVTAVFHVKASPKVVYGVLTDYAHMPEFMPMVEEVKTLESRPKGALVSFRVRYLRFFDIVEVDERTYEPPTRISWHAIQGPLKVSNGSWTLTPERGGTRVTYQTDVDPGIPLPSAMTGMLVKQGLPEFLNGVRLRAESGGTWKKLGR
jgi:ribosome-associated toxin RatA of RatAB toxin-antitoxin module